MLSSILEGKGTEKVGAIRADLQKTMEADMQVFRTGRGHRTLAGSCAELEERYKNIAIRTRASQPRPARGC